MSKRGKGRPPREGEAMLEPITVRLPKAMMERIDAIVEKRALEGVDKSSVIRELLARALRSEKE
jgi:Arc/MetJ-type ribon-helix-helix transcriptional regulator